MEGDQIRARRREREVQREKFCWARREVPNGVIKAAPRAWGRGGM